MKEIVCVLLKPDFPLVICKSQIAEGPVESLRGLQGTMRPALSSVRLQWGVKQTQLQAFV